MVDLYDCVTQVFDGHGGPEAAAFIKKNVMRLFFEDVKFPQTSEVDEIFSEELENSLRKSFHLADLALADDCNVNSSSGTTALTAMIFGRYIFFLPLCPGTPDLSNIESLISINHQLKFFSLTMLFS